LEGTLEMIDFVSVSEYLFLLRIITQSMSRIGSHAMHYLAAAVSDFYIPQKKMVSTRLLKHGNIKRFD
jgi:phosphopantothenate---cysteine ligase (ATP)